MAGPIPAPTFSVGDVVYKGEAVMNRKRLSCPDCGDAGEVEARLQHETIRIACPRCQFSGPNLRHSLEVHEYEPRVTTLTIGSIKVDTENEHPVSYMAKETGVGSGTIHYEKDLFHSQEQARAHAENISAVRNTTDNPQRERNEINRSRSVMPLTEAIRREYYDRVADIENEMQQLVGVLTDILEYGGGAPSPLEDEYLMDRAHESLKKARGEA